MARKKTEQAETALFESRMSKKHVFIFILIDKEKKNVNQISRGNRCTPPSNTFAYTNELFSNLIMLFNIFQHR